MSVTQTAKKISAMEIRGALDIAIAATEALERELKGLKGTTNSQIKQLKKAGTTLKKARPSAISLPNAVNYVIHIAEENRDLIDKEFRRKTREDVREFIREQKESLHKIAEYGANLIEGGDTLLTHCNSDTVVEVFKKAQEDGKRIEVLCTETRPRHQGYLSAKALSKAKIPTKLIVDSAVHYAMKEYNVDKVFVGADTVFSNGYVINKIGTSQVALCAKHMEVDFIVATETIKFSPESVHGKTVEIEMRDPGEVTKLSGVEILNPAFDVTEAEYVDSIVTEKGVIHPSAVYQLIKEEFGWMFTEND